jgi:hypothetical protein
MDFIDSGVGDGALMIWVSLAFAIRFITLVLGMKYYVLFYSTVLEPPVSSFSALSSCGLPTERSSLALQRRTPSFLVAQ